MKRLSSRRKRWLARHARSAARRRSKQKLDLRNKRRNEIGLESTGVHKVEVHYLGGKRTVLAEGRLPVPRRLCFQTARADTLHFVKTLGDAMDEAITRIQADGSRSRTVSNRMGKYFDFSQLEWISPSAALVLAAEYDRARTATGRSLFTVNYRAWPTTLKQQLSDLGYLEMLGIRYRSPETTERPIRILKLQHGDIRNNPVAGALVDELVAMATSSQDRFDIIQASYHGLIEAMDNVLQHAYKDIREPVPRWWITGAFNRDAHAITIALYDRGLSIPATLPHWTLSGTVKGWLTAKGYGWDDANAIEAAMSVVRSSTGEPHRGKGLPQLKEVLDYVPYGKLRIVSRAGDVVFCNDMPAEKSIIDPPLRGTLVEWELQL